MDDIKEITTQITFANGSYILAGTWKPSSNPEYEEKDLMHVVFLTVNIQYTRDFGVLQPVEGDKTSPKNNPSPLAFRWDALFLPSPFLWYRSFLSQPQANGLEASGFTEPLHT